MPIFPSAQDKLVRPYPFARPRAPGCTTRTFSNICLHCLTYAHTLPESREMWHFRMKCVVDDTSGGGRVAAIYYSPFFVLFRVAPEVFRVHSSVMAASM